MTARNHPVVEAYAAHVSPAFVKLLGALGYGRVFVRAKGTRLWDHDGREYLDLLAGFGSMNLGHNPEAVIEAVRAALDDGAPSILHVGPHGPAADLAADLARLAPPLTRCLFSTSGGEAVESAMKLARAATGRTAIVYADGGFHGTGLGSLSVMGSRRMRAPFEPLVPDCHAVAFGDLDALRKALRKRPVAAVLLEPIQVEAGVVVPPAGYLAEARALCHAHGALFVLDEVQTGLGRTGALFAYQHDDAVPDVLVLGKALGGSILPVSCALTTPAIHDRAYGRVDRFDLHGSTFSGYALGCAAARATLRAIADHGLVDAARARGERLLLGLRSRLAGHPFVRGVRGRGLIVGIELGPTAKGGVLSRLLPGVVAGVSRQVFGQWLALRLLEAGFVAQPASSQWNVLRIEPALTVTDDEIDRAIDAIATILGEYRDLGALLADAGARLGAQALGGFGF